MKDESGKHEEVKAQGGSLEPEGARRRSREALVTNTPKVDFDLLGESDEIDAALTHDGRLFTGVAYEKDAAGRLVSLSGYRDGKACGPLRTWYPSGQIEQELYYCGGGLHGPWREWYPNGEVRVDAYYERGHIVRSKRWGEDGTLVENERDERSRNARLGKAHPGNVDLGNVDLGNVDLGNVADLAEARAHRKNPLLDIDLGTWEFVKKTSRWGRNPSELPSSATLWARVP